MPGSCGELVQGCIDGVDFHISWPINRFSTATISMVNGRTMKVPEGLVKTARAIEKAFVIINPEDGVEIEISSDIPVGKGMASSTADIGAALIGTFEIFGVKIAQKTIAKTALSVEPTDGTLFDGIVAFDHIKGQMLETIGGAPPVDLIVLEPPGSLDTVRFNGEKQKLAEETCPADERIIKEAYEMAVTGIKNFDIKLIGEAATISATLNQKLLPKPELSDIISVCKSKGAAGVNVAHSGTVMGVLVEHGFAERLLDKISHYIPKGWKAYPAKVIDGGARHGLNTRSILFL